MQEIINLFTVVGISGIVAAFFNFIFSSKQKIRLKETDKKYKIFDRVHLLMYGLLKGEHEFELIKQRRPDLNTKEKLKSEIRVEMLNMMLFANDEVIDCICDFLVSQSNSLYLKTLKAMKKDLYGKSSHIKIDKLSKLIDSF